MKELSPHIRKRLPPLKLYLEDIEFLVNRLKSISNEITIKTATHEFENVSEFSDTQKEPFRTLQIASRRPYLIVELNKSSASIYLSEDLPDGRGVFEQIDSYLRKRRRTFTSILTSPVLIVSYLILVSFAPFFLTKVVPPPFQLFGLLVWVSFFLFLYLVAFFLHTQTYTIVIPKRRSDAPSFWERNWEKIALALIAGFVGFFLGWLSKLLPGPK
jgi:hypothetical protein